MTPTELGDLVREIIAGLCGLAAGVWMLVAYRAHKLRGLQLSPSTIWASAAFFLLLATSTVIRVFQERGRPWDGTPLVTIIGLLLLVGMTATFLRDAWRRQRKSHVHGHHQSKEPQ